MNQISAILSRFRSPIERLNLAFAGAIVCMAACVFVLCKFSAKDLLKSDTVLNLPIACLVALASFATGSLLGFLFGIPKTLQNNSGTSAKNTSLEQISDWLTKIIVGVGLTQLNKLRDHFTQLSENVGAALLANTKLKEEGTIIAGALLLFSVLIGFLVTYLWTRLFLDKIEQSDVEAAIKNVDDADRSARDLAIQQLNGSNIGTSQLLSAFKTASGNAITNIYILAESALNATDKSRIANAIPVFEALILLDENLDYPQNHVQAGLAYMKKENADTASALNHFDKAVDAYRKKTPPVKIGLLLYYRTKCRLAQLNNAPDKETEETLVKDIDEAAAETYVLDMMKKDANAFVMKVVKEKGWVS